MSMIPRDITGFIIAGSHSGVGKTTASFAIMTALTNAGFVVQPFKIGPDFIDPGYHHLSTGRVSINLDRWMMGLRAIRADLAKYARTADVTVIEGMGALHDGEDGLGRGSSAYFARRLHLPLLLVVDIWGMTRSTAALIQGFADFDKEVEIAGLLLNRAGSRRHFEMVRDALPSHWRQRVVGYLPADERLHVRERHLGLLTVEENADAGGMREYMGEVVRHSLDIQKLVRIFGIRRGAHASLRTIATEPRVRIGIAHDRAFCFYYQENLRRLHEAGAELVSFSPLADDCLPDNIHGLYIGGGYPELFASTLADNKCLLRVLHTFGKEGKPIYAECGGLIYLAQGLTDFDGNRYKMASLLPLEIMMDSAHLAIRYVRIETTRASLLGPAGMQARGQEFHQSRIVFNQTQRSCYAVRDSTGSISTEGFVHKRILGSYIHLHFASNKRIPVHFVGHCEAAATPT